MIVAGHAVSARTLSRLALLVLALVVFVVAFGPPRWVAQAGGWRFGERIPVWFQRLLCAGLGVRVRAHGAFDPEARQLIVANHVSWLDIPVMGSVAPMAFLAKKEVGKHSLGRQLVALQGAVYVDRKRRTGIPAVNASMAEAIRTGSPVVLFAEATTGDGVRLLRFRSSHFEAVRQAAPGDNERPTVVQPVYLDYSHIAGLPTARNGRPKIAWYGDMTFLPHFFAFAEAGGATCDVHFGSPIRVAPHMDRKTIARAAEKAVRALAASTPARLSRA